jgi:hypothetical protein
MPSPEDTNIALSMMAGGPILEYLQVTSKSNDALEGESAKDDTRAAVIFAAKIHFRAIVSLDLTIESAQNFRSKVGTE